MDAACRAGLPVPRVCARGAWQDRPALLLDWCPGRPVLEELVKQPARAGRIGALFGARQACIHAAPQEAPRLRHPLPQGLRSVRPLQHPRQPTQGDLQALHQPAAVGAVMLLRLVPDPG